MNRILFICNESITVINFRKELILFLLSKGFNVTVAVGDDKYIDKIKKLGVDVVCKKYSNRSKSPLKNVGLFLFFKKVIKSLKPDLIFTFQLKPNVFGTLAARKTHIPVLNMVEGLGDPFTSKSFSMKLVRLIVSRLYKKSFKYSKRVFFLNDDDKEEFINRKIVKPDLAFVLNGIGIDTKLYIPNYDLSKEKKVLYLSRLLKNKGVIEYCKLARIVKKKRPDIIFELYGSESELTKEDIADYINDKSVYYGGFSSEVDKLIYSSRIFAMTSFREGFPRTIMESMALGRPVIAFDTIGVRSAVIDGKTGYLIPFGDLNGFANRIIELIDDDKKIIELGKNARESCVEQCDSNIINGKILEIISSHIKERNK